MGVVQKPQEIVMPIVSLFRTYHPCKIFPFLMTMKQFLVLLSSHLSWTQSYDNNHYVHKIGQGLIMV